ncbi:MULTISPECIES: alpha/beta fold hydrolase [unclassified Cryobacterium]|uniref:alpha/beta fold hydrolase n=1 Tax=unclassified Cryobacterium TaxID=2649013 RepID=UPI002AB468C1|nr:MULTISPECIES: alpha/beta fold hydrolase [unclassified Cryobacterium]MDY7544015.1 alpha/beta fold hydrolase [Cryobacterium sp. 5B3]MEA9997871.1 alpha/beta fold hydrolase [Cryobacterium sp. RTS3]MEB0265423.1 alpha/beta fold hydrolase [Cryobacterium sp. 10I5]MEB0273202.1 alpha/beta fold hydrolase [Cryobacterium sp. 5B3]
MNTRTAPDHRFVYSADGVNLATYEFGDPAHPTVLAVHGFASSAVANWHATGWTRDLLRAGFHVIAIDQRGHGLSDKPHSPSAYSMDTLVADVQQVLDAYLLDEVVYAGYSLGARVGWQAARELEGRIVRAVLGGIPDGNPLTRFQVADARAHIEHGAEVGDRLTGAYLTMAKALPGNDLGALVALVEGMRGGPQPGADNAPPQPLLFATGSEDRILEASRALAEATPAGSFFEIPGRNHFNAPTSRAFRDAAIAFLGATG